MRFAEAKNRDVLSLPERVFHAVERAGGRRGLARRTRETYARWCVRFAKWVGDAKPMLDQGRARDFLTYLVVDEKQSFSTQKQALNALVFFKSAGCAFLTLMHPVVRGFFCLQCPHRVMRRCWTFGCGDAAAIGR